MNILRAIEGLSADTDAKKTDNETKTETAAAAKGENVQSSVPSPASSRGYAEGLLERHERAVNRIRRGKI